MLLSAALIVRDEAAHLRACLESISGVVDEVVVVDTGSTDATRDIAVASGATVIDEPWRDDFAGARNVALDHASGEWILYIDADERLVHAGDLRGRLEDDAQVGMLVRFQVGPAYTRYWEYRLFRNRPDVRFRGVIHETMVPDLRTVMEREGLTIGDSEVELAHLGYEGEQEHKHRRDLPLLLAAVAERPGRSYLWHRLGRAHAGLGHPSDAEAAWERGVEVVRGQDRVEPIDALVYADLVACRVRGRPDASRSVVEEMAERFPGEHLGRWAAAQQAMVDGRYADAIEPLEALARVDADALVHPCLAYDRRLFGEWAYHVLGLCWFQLGEPAVAASWLRRAVRANPGEREYEVKLQLAEAQSAR